MAPGRPVRLFISYADKDQSLKKDLETHLSLLRRQGLIEVWSERPIIANQAYQGLIDEKLETADIVLLLVTPSFMASDYCYEGELARAMELHRKGEIRVIPVIAKTVDMTGAPFVQLQGLPSDGRAIVKWDDQDDAWLNVVRGLRLVIDVVSRKPAKDASVSRGVGLETQVTQNVQLRAPVDRGRLLQELERMLPLDFDRVLFYTDVPHADLPGESAGQAKRAMELVKYFQKKGESGLLTLEQVIRQIRAS